MATEVFDRVDLDQDSHLNREEFAHFVSEFNAALEQHESCSFLWLQDKQDGIYDELDSIYPQTVGVARMSITNLFYQIAESLDLL